MKQFSVKELYKNLSSALKELPFEITYYNRVIAVVYPPNVEQPVEQPVNVDQPVKQPVEQYVEIKNGMNDAMRKFLEKTSTTKSSTTKSSTTKSSTTKSSTTKSSTTKSPTESILGGETFLRCDICKSTENVRQAEFWVWEEGDKVNKGKRFLCQKCRKKSDLVKNSPLT